MPSRRPDLRVRISADLDDIKKGLGVLRADLAKVKADGAKAAPDARTWEANIGRIREAVVRLGAAYVGVQGVRRGIGELFDSLDRADELYKLAQATGVSVEALSRLGYAARLNAADVQLLGRGLLKLSQDATKNQGLLQGLGIETTDAAGNVRDAASLFLDLSDVFATLPDGATKSALAMRLLGEDIGPRLVPLLNAGRQGLADLGLEAERTGNLVTTTAGQAAVEFNDNLARLKLQATGLANEVANKLAPALNAYAEAAATAGGSTNRVERAGEATATALKVMATPLVVAKNLFEALANNAFFAFTALSAISDLVYTTTTRSVKDLGQSLRDLATGDLSVGGLLERIKSGMDGVGADAEAALAKIRAGASAAREGIAESARDVAALGKLFERQPGGAQPPAPTGNAAAEEITKTGDAASEAEERVKKLEDRIRSLLNGDNGAGGAAVGGLAASTVLAQDEIQRQQAALDQQFASGALSARAYYSERLALQQRLIDLQIEQLQTEASLTTELARRRGVEERIVILQRNRAQLATAAARDQATAEAAQAASRGAALRGRASDLAAGLSAQEQSISAQVSAGSLGPLEGERRLRDLRSEALAQLRVLRQEQSAYLASLAPGDPNLAAARAGLAGIDTAIANVQASMQQLRQDTMDVGVSALTTFFTNLREGATSAAGAFRDLVADFGRGIYDMLAQATAQRLVGAIGNLFGAGNEGAGQSAQQGAVALSGAALATTAAGGAISAGATQLSAAAGQVLAAATALAAANATGGGQLFGLAHGGGVAGALHMYRSGINPQVFGAAPRYHGGAVAGLGLQHNEVPAILERGETIRTQQQESALTARLDAAAGAGAGPMWRNIIVFSDDELADALSGGAGERMVVTHVRRNRGAIDA